MRELLIDIYDLRAATADGAIAVFVCASHSSHGHTRAHTGARHDSCARCECEDKTLMRRAEGAERWEGRGGGARGGSACVCEIVWRVSDDVYAP